MSEEKKYRKALKELTRAVICFENEMENIMSMPSTVERGEKIAEAMNFLTIANQEALRFTLGHSFNAIEKLYSTRKDK